MGSPSYAGIDWATRKHALCVLDADGTTLVSQVFSHSEAGIREMVAQMQSLGACRVAIERPDGLLVDRLIEGGLTVLPINAGALVETRPRFEAGGGKTDLFDAFCLAELARTDAHRYRLLRPDSDETRTLRVLIRAREGLVKTRVHLSNQLGAQLDGFWPGAARTFRFLHAPIALAFLRAYPSPSDARGLDEEGMAAFLKESSYSGSRLPADLLERLRSAPAGSVGAAEAEVRRAAVLGLVTLLEAIVAEIGGLQSQIFQAAHAHPDGKIFLPLFRSPTSVLTAASLIAEIGDDRGRYADSGALEAKAGMAPVVRESGRKRIVIFRYACNRRLQSAVSVLADSTRRTNPWAKSIYEASRARGHRHPHALRVLGRAWLRVLWRCWQDEVAYDPAKHGARRRLKEAEAEAPAIGEVPMSSPSRAT